MPENEDYKKKIFVINGCAGVGKDSFVSMIQAVIPSFNYSSVHYINEAAKILGWDGVKNERSRRFLSDLKFLSTEYNDFPFISLCNVINRFMNDDEVHEWLFLHVREPAEIRRLVEKYPSITTILVVNPHVDEVMSNVADAGVRNYSYDVIINNDMGLAELKVKADEFIEKYREIENAEV